MPIGYANQGEVFKIREIVGGRGISVRLSEIGVYPGSTVKIISNQGTGPIVIGIGDAKVALGRGMAMKIIGEPIKKVA